MNETNQTKNLDGNCTISSSQPQTNSSSAETTHGQHAPTTQEIVQRYLGEVDWIDGVRGRCKCPGQHKHTSKSHRNDCWVFVNGTPTVSCLHHSCRAEVDAANDKIRSAWSLFQPVVDAEVLRAAKEKAARRHELEARAKASVPEILKQYRWDVDEIVYDNTSFNYGFEKQTAAFLEHLFKANDILWTGNPEDSGREWFAGNFISRDAWIMGGPLGNYTCASTFKPGVWSRKNENVASTPYMIVEGDNINGTMDTVSDATKLLNKNACGAVFRWLRDGCGLGLRAVVDAGNKSLHGWFDMPSAAKFEELKVVLPAMGCDRAMFKPTQPARIPGVIRDNGNEQRLLWVA